MIEINNIRRGNLVQIIAGLVFVGCLVILFLSSFDIVKAKARDIKRRADIKVLVKALDLYHDKYGKYPDSFDDWRGWDLSIAYNGKDKNFLNNLKAESLIDRSATDPINSIPYHYRYQKYPAGAYGCKTGFYILQAVKFELANKNNGQGSCPKFNWLEIAPNGYTVQGFD